MNTSLTAALHEWFLEHKEKLASVGIATEYTESRKDHVGSARVDLESDRIMGRATVWDEGFCDLEVLSMETGEQLLYRHHEGLDSNHLASVMEGLLERFHVR